jgi:hypothetical protein
MRSDTIRPCLERQSYKVVTDDRFASLAVRQLWWL